MTDSQYPPPDGQPQYGHSGQPQQYGQPGQQPQQYGQQGGYGPGGGWAPAAVSRPPAMDKAVQLMKVGAVIGVLNALTALLMRSQMRDAVVDANNTQPDNARLTPDQIDAAVSVGLVTALIIGLIGAGLWLWMASANGKGKSWARVVATIFFVLSVLSFVSSFLQPQPMAARLLALLTVLVGAGAIFFMYQKESTAFYEASSRR